MIAIAKNVDLKKSPQNWHAGFLAMLPAIREQANPRKPLRYQTQSPVNTPIRTLLQSLRRGRQDRRAVLQLDADTIGFPIPLQPGCREIRLKYEIALLPRSPQRTEFPTAMSLVVRIGLPRIFGFLGKNKTAAPKEQGDSDTVCHDLLLLIDHDNYPYFPNCARSNNSQPLQLSQVSWARLSKAPRMELPALG